jgi:hypothetical protein
MELNPVQVENWSLALGKTTGFKVDAVYLRDKG